MGKLFVKGTAFVLIKRDWEFLAFGLALKNGHFILQKGSSFRADVAGGFPNYRNSAKVEREKILSEGLVIKRPSTLHPVLTDDYKFRNISLCTSVILGQSRSGDYWVSASGLTYPEWAKATVRKVKE